MLEELQARVRRLEDESAIQRLIMLYGPAADAGLARSAASAWAADGIYDWDAGVDPIQGAAGVEQMLRGDMHRGLINHGAAHFAGPLLVTVDGDEATALNYSLVMRRDDVRFYLWRVSAVRWDLERSGSSWRVRRRTNRLLDASGAGRQLFEDTMGEVFVEATR